MLDLVARTVTEDDERDQGQPRGQGRHQDGGQAFLRAPQHEVPAEGLTLHPFEMLAVVDQQDAVARGDPEHGEEADQRARAR